MTNVRELAFLLAPHAVLLFDDDGIILDANEEASVLFGTPRLEIVGKNLGLFGPSASYDFRPGIRGLVAAGHHAGEVRMTRGNGDVFDAAYSSRANVSPGVHLTIVRDVSDRKRMELSLRASEQLFARSVIAAPAAICVSSRARQTCLLANEQFLKLTGYWRSETVGTHLPSGRLWAVASDRRELVTRLDSDGLCPPMPATFRRKDGSLVQVVVSAGRTEVNQEDCEIIAAFEALQLPDRADQ